MYDKYSNEQKKIMALLAYYCLVFHYTPSDKVSGQIAASNFGCAILGIPDHILFKIRSKGLQNLNRISHVNYFEDNYVFDPYA